jgi:hypothetical protein
MGEDENERQGQRSLLCWPFLLRGGREHELCTPFLRFSVFPGYELEGELSHSSKCFSQKSPVLFLIIKTLKHILSTFDVHKEIASGLRKYRKTRGAE